MSIPPEPYAHANELEQETHRCYDAVEAAIDRDASESELEQLHAAFLAAEQRWTAEVQRTITKGQHQWKAIGDFSNPGFPHADTGKVMACLKCDCRFIQWPDGRVVPVKPIPVPLKCPK